MQGTRLGPRSYCSIRRTRGYTWSTVSASFMIEMLVDDDFVNMWDGTTLEGLWEDGPTDAYSAEVNLVGTLLYGYNWDTRDRDPGWYRMTFTLLDVRLIGRPTRCTSETGYVEYDIEYPVVTIRDDVDPYTNPDPTLGHRLHGGATST